MTKQPATPKNGHLSSVQKATPADYSAAFFYVCAHGASNDGCPEHFPGAKPVPQNWADTYEPPAPPGITDDASIG